VTNNPRAAGLVTVFGDKTEELPTLRCVHCGGHWTVRPGSGRVRGFCQNCMGPVCGPGCAACVPVDLMLTNLEVGRAWDYVPVVVPVTR
jgi:hypothetical protein